MLNRSGLCILLFLVAWVAESQARYRRIGSFGVKLKPNGAYRVRTKGKAHTTVEVHTPPVWKNKHAAATPTDRLVTLHFAWMRRVLICSKMSTLALLPEASLPGIEVYKSMVPHPLPFTRHITEREVAYISFGSTLSNISWYKHMHRGEMRVFQRVHVLTVRNHVFYIAPGMLSLSYIPPVTSSRVEQIGPKFGKQALSVKRYLCSRWKRYSWPEGVKGYTTGYMNANLISVVKRNTRSQKDCSCSYFTLTSPPPRRDIKVARVVIHRNTLRKTHGTKSFYVQFPTRKSKLSLDYYHDTNAMISFGKMPPVRIHTDHIPTPLPIPALSNSKHRILHLFQTMVIHQPTQPTTILALLNKPYLITQFMSTTEEEVQQVQYGQSSSNMRSIAGTLEFYLRHDLQHKYITLHKRCKESWLSGTVCTGVHSSSARPSAEGPQTYALISKLFTKRAYRNDMFILQHMRSLVIVDLYGAPCVVNVAVLVEEQHRLVSFATMTKVISVEHQKSTISHHRDHLGYDSNTVVIECIGSC